VNQPPYSYSPIVSRPPLSFPGGARLAFYVGVNIERFRIDMPFGPGGNVPDPLAYGLRDYGNRVGIWRLMDLFDRHPVFGVRSTILPAIPDPQAADSRWTPSRICYAMHRTTQ